MSAKTLPINVMWRNMAHKLPRIPAALPSSTQRGIASDDHEFIIVANRTNEPIVCGVPARPNTLRRQNAGDRT